MVNVISVTQYRTPEQGHPSTLPDDDNRMIIQDSPALIFHRTYRYKGQIRPYQKSRSLVMPAHEARPE